MSSHDGEVLKISAKGAVTFTDDDMDVASVSPGGFVTIEHSTGRIFTSSERFEARAVNGGVQRHYYKNGSEIGADEGRAWLRGFLPTLLRDMAVNADQRVARALDKGGPTAVLDLVNSTNTAYAKSVYLRELYKQRRLDGAMLARSLGQAARQVTSDYDLAEVLIAAADHQPIDQAMPDFVAAAGNVKSDYDERRVLSRALANPSLTTSAASAIFKAATPGMGGTGISSAYDLAELLSAAPPAMISQDASGWAAAVRTIDSAYDRRRAISAALTKGAAASTVDAALDATAGLSSAYDLAELLIECERQGLLSDQTAPAYLKATSAISSHYDRRRTLEAVARSPIGDRSLADAAALAGGIGSDYERAEALIALGHARGVGPAARKALQDAAMGIRSDYDRGRVLSDFAKSGVLVSASR